MKSSPADRAYIGGICAGFWAIVALRMAFCMIFPWCTRHDQDGDDVEKTEPRKKATDGEPSGDSEHQSEATNNVSGNYAFVNHIKHIPTF